MKYFILQIVILSTTLFPVSAINNISDAYNYPGEPGLPGTGLIALNLLTGGDEFLVSIDFSASASNYSFPGEIIEFAVTVTNSGTTALTGIVITDSLTGTVTHVAHLDPQDSFTTTNAYTVTQGDLNFGSIVNHARVTSSEGATASSGPLTIFAVQNINLAATLTTVTPGVFSVPGETITYQVTIENSGNVTLTGVTVAGNHQGSTTATIASIDPGAIVTTTFYYTITQVDIDFGAVTNGATVNSDQGASGLTGNLVINAVQNYDLAISITSSANTFTNVNETLSFTIELSNLGNTTLHNIIVRDNIANLDTLIITLTPGSTSSLSTNYNVTQDNITTGHISKSITATSGSHQFESNILIAAVQNPAIEISLVPSATIFRRAGEVITYNVSVSNTGNVPLSSVNISESLTGYSQLIHQLDPGQSYQFFTSHTISATDLVSGVVTNTVTSNAMFGTGSLIRQATTSAIVNASDLLISVVANNSTPGVGENIGLNITVTNNGPDLATNVLVNAPLPGGFNHVSHTLSSGSFNPLTGDWNPGALNSGGSASLAITVSVNPPGAGVSYNLLATVTADQHDHAVSNNQSMASVIPRQADLSVSQEVNQPRPDAGDQVTFTITALNHGPHTGIGAVVTKMLPSGLAYVSHSATVGTYNPSTGKWDIGGLAPLSPVTLIVRATVAPPSPSAIYSTTVTISGSHFDPAIANNSSTITLTPLQSDLRLIKTVNNQRPLVNEPVNFTIGVTNNGPDQATVVRVTDILPNGFTYVGHDAGRGTFNSATGLWTVGTIAHGEQINLTINTTVNVPTAGISFNNRAIAAATQFDPDVSNNHAEASAVPLQSNLALAVSVNNNMPHVNELVRFTITLVNNGPDNATGIELHNNIPRGLRSVSAISGNGQLYNATIRWQGINLAAGATRSFTFDAVTNPSTGAINEFMNIALLAALDQFDPQMADNNASITLNMQNTLPVATSDSYATIEDIPLSVPFEHGLLANDSDPDLNNMLVVDFTTPAGTFPAGTTASGITGNLTVQANGSLVFIPAENYHGLATGFSYRITDGMGLSSSTFDIMVAAVNDYPVVNDDFLFTAESTPVNMNLLANDNDNADGTNGGIAPSTIRVVRQPARGTIIILPNYTINYTPHAGFHGTDTAFYEVCDTGYPLPAKCGQAAIFINVTRRSPIAFNDIITTNEDTPVEFNPLQNDDDTDLDPNSIAIIVKPLHGTATHTGNGIVRYTPNPDFNGNDFFTYTVRDHANLVSNVATVNLTVVPVPDRPVAKDGLFTTRENVPVTIYLNQLVSDPDNDLALNSIIITRAPSSGSLAPGTTPGEFTYTPATGFAGKDSLRFQISDFTGLASNVATITIQVSNQAPIAMDDEATTIEDQHIVIPVLDNDTDPQDNIDPAMVAIIYAPLNGTAVANQDGTITYTPGSNFHGTDQFYYRVRDLTGYTDNARVTITVTAVNDSPVAVNDNVTLPQDGNIFIDILNNDHDVDNPSETLQISITRQPANGVANVTTSPAGVLYTPRRGFSGRDQFTYEIKDPGGLKDTATVFITITWVNSPPVALNDTFGPIGIEGMILNVLQNDLDPDKNIKPSSISIISPARMGQVSINADGSLFYIPGQRFFGTDNFTYSVCDSLGMCSQATVLLHVATGNSPPVANDLLVTLPEDTPVIFNPVANDTDPNNNLDMASLRVLRNPARGTLALQGGLLTMTYTPGPDFFGYDSLRYEICDTGQPVFCDQATVYFIIEPVNDAPRPQPDVLHVLDNLAGTINVLANDIEPEGEPTRALLVSPTATNLGTITLSLDGNLTYVANRGKYNLVDTIYYKACDPSNLCSHSLVVVHIKPLDEDNDGIPDNLVIPGTFSPNGDGVNDYWIIRGIEEFESSELSIFNRWGSLVYHVSPYDNRWDGRASTPVPGSQVLPEGTYFYVVRINNRYFKGTIFINR